jgi:hypothetical protein
LITVASVEIHKVGADDDSGWFPLKINADPTFDLLQIRGLESVLAVGNLIPSSYNQKRMDITNVEVIFNNQRKTARPPPAASSGYFNHSRFPRETPPSCFSTLML